MITASVQKNVTVLTIHHLRIQDWVKTVWHGRVLLMVIVCLPWDVGYCILARDMIAMVEEQFTVMILCTAQMYANHVKNWLLHMSYQSLYRRQRYLHIHYQLYLLRLLLLQREICGV
jgi:hypothetical protein